MAVFVRKNALICSTALKNLDGTPLITQPSAATAQLSYKNLAGLVNTATITLVYGGTAPYLTPGQWSGTWDSSAAGTCTVYWVVYTEGVVEAAAQGEFRLIANTANVI